MHAYTHDVYLAHRVCACVCVLCMYARVCACPGRLPRRTIVGRVEKRGETGAGGAGERVREGEGERGGVGEEGERRSGAEKGSKRQRTT